jgi:hypothetical protein
MSVFTNPASGAAADGLSETQGLEENRTMIRMFLVAAGSAAFLGCSATDSTGPKDDGLVTVFGVVTHIEDKVPVDGGVTITVDLDRGGSETLFFGSLFTYPPPDEEMLELYEKILEAKVGSRVKAVGIAVLGGIGLKDLVVLED